MNKSCGRLYRLLQVSLPEDLFSESDTGSTLEDDTAPTEVYIDCQLDLIQ